MGLCVLAEPFQPRVQADGSSMNAPSCRSRPASISLKRQFGTANPSLYRLMFSADVDKKAFPKLDEAGASAFAELLGILERGQQNGAFKKQPVHGQAAAAWSLVHGFTLLAIDGQLLPGKVGANPIDAVLASLLEGLES